MVASRLVELGKPAPSSKRFAHRYVFVQGDVVPSFKQQFSITGLWIFVHACFSKFIDMKVGRCDGTEEVWV